MTGKWTRFMDMHSGGRQKEAWPHIFIEAPEHEAEIIFQNRFGHNPHRVTCTCCGPDYSIGDDRGYTLDQVTGFDRACAWDEKANAYVEKPAKWGTYMTLQEYMDSGQALFIFEQDIKPEEREGSLRASGYRWVGD